MEAASTAAPAQTIHRTPQHMQALEHANHIRLARAALKRSVKAGDRSVADVVQTCPLEVETMTVSELLRSQRRWGRTRATKFLTPLAVHENREIGRLTTRQRNELAVRLEAKAATAV